MVYVPRVSGMFEQQQCSSATVHGDDTPVMTMAGELDREEIGQNKPPSEGIRCYMRGALCDGCPRRFPARCLQFLLSRFGEIQRMG